MSFARLFFWRHHVDVVRDSEVLLHTWVVLVLASGFVRLVLADFSLGIVINALVKLIIT